MTDVNDLLRAREAAAEALADAEAGAVERLIAAKAAHRANQNPQTLAAKLSAAEELRAVRAAVREGRTGLVAGDAYQTGS